MFLLDGCPLSIDVPFEHCGIQYPANWLRLSTPSERAAIKITEVSDLEPYDQRFYYGYNKVGDLVPKEHDKLVTLWSNQTRTKACTLLTPTDWQIVRQIDNGTGIDPEIQKWREQVRVACNKKIVKITNTKTTFELAAYVTSEDYVVWPIVATNKPFLSS